ncbi:MAG: Calx-beta domain-containing protein, partial [Planctomycetaceae bacterium]
PGETSKTISADVVGDTAYESNESFTVALSGVTGNATIKTASAVGTITNDDAQPTPPTLAISSVAALESAGAFVFTVTLSSASATSVSVRFATADVTASSRGKSADYSSVSGTLTFSPGETSKTIAVAVRNDTVVEQDETFVVSLSRSAGAAIAVSQGTGTIRNDDGVLAAAFASLVTTGSPSSPKRR